MSDALSWPFDDGDAGPGRVIGRALATGMRGLLVAVALWACVGPPSAWLLESLRPAQRAVFAALLPDFEVRSFALEQRGAHTKLRAESTNRRYLVLQRQVVQPGFVFEVETPARVGLFNAALIVAGAALILPWTKRSIGAAAAIVTPAILAMMTVLAPLILAGQQWGLGLGAFDELSLPALCVTVSDFMLHGGSLAVCAAVVWLAKSAAGR